MRPKCHVERYSARLTGDNDKDDTYIYLYIASLFFYCRFKMANILKKILKKNNKKNNVKWLIFEEE